MIFVALTIKADEHKQRDPDVYNDNVRKTIDKPIPTVVVQYDGQAPFTPPSNWVNGMNAYLKSQPGTIKKGPSWQRQTASSKSMSATLHEQTIAKPTGFDPADF
jgi:hypothetical protein